jgi:hypothetical protein
VLGEALPALTAHMLATWSEASSAAPQGSSGAWSQLWSKLGLGNGAGQGPQSGAQGEGVPQLSGAATAWAPLYSACVQRVGGVPQEAEEVGKLLDSMLSGLWLAQASVCSSAQVAVAAAKNGSSKPAPGQYPVTAIEELSSDERRLLSAEGMQRHDQAWVPAGSGPGRLLRANATQVRRWQMGAQQST